MTEPPPDPAPFTTTQSLGLGCLGFVGFFGLAAVGVPIALGAGPIGATVIALVLLYLAVRAGRAVTPRRRAQLARVAIGFACAAVVFGGCIVLISSANFH